MIVKTKILKIATVALLGMGAVSSVAVAAFGKNETAKASAYYTPSTTYSVSDTAAELTSYYSSISDSATGSTLLSALQSLNSSKRKRTVGYSTMGTSTSGAFIYTDYDLNNTATDSNGQIYGTKVASFYTKTSATSWNREHVWPNSRGGSNVEADILHTRPTITSENSSRGNSFYVEGMNHSSNGWDPYTAGYDAAMRGECARIILYSVVASTSLKLSDASSISSGSSGYTTTMGDMDTLVKWHYEYTPNVYEINRNNGAEYLQGNRNPFVDHPEYVARIWGSGDTSVTGYTSAVNSYCSSNASTYDSWTPGNASSYGTNDGATTTAPENLSLSGASTIAVGGTTTLTVSTTTSGASTSVTWTSSNTSVATVSNGVVTGKAVGTTTITATSTVATSVKATKTITVKAISSITTSGTLSKTSYTAGQAFDPTGLTITAHYSDSSTATIDGSDVVWSALSEGDTSVTGTYGGVSFTVSGITVEASTATGYTQVTSTSDLVSGGVYLIGNKANNVAAGSLSGKYLTSQSVTFSGDSITDKGSAQEFTLGGTSGAWTFTGAIDGLIYCSAAKTLSTSSGTSTWSISISSGTATIASTNNSYGSIYYNSGSPRFTTYTSTNMQAVQLYKASSGSSSSDTITLNQTSLSLVEGGSATLTPTTSGSGTVTWASSDSSVATVSGGTVTAVAAGTATITATYGTASATCAVTVTEAASVLTVTEARTKALNSDTGTYSVQGIVTEFDYAESGSIKGFYINDTNGIGIDVYTGTSLDLGVTTGQLVTVNGTLKLFNSLPEITSPTLVSSSHTADTVTPISISSVSEIGSNVGNLLSITATYTSDGSTNSKINDTFTVGSSTFVLYSSYASSEAATNYTAAKANWTAGSTEVNLVGIGQLYNSTYEIILTDLTVNTIISGDFAQDFLNSITCNSLGTTAPTFTGNPYSSWSEIAAAYSSLTTTQQGVLTSTIANESGTTAQQAVAKYDYIVGKYGSDTYDDFMGRNPSPISGNAGILSKTINPEGLYIILAVVSASILTALAIAYVITKKQKGLSK